MADLDHNLSLADALTEPPPEIEEEVKRDFIATLEAEKFDDVVGETVNKTDYVPLLDDDDAKAGSQEPKSKAHADSIQVEHTSASGPTVLENGDHGIEDHRPVFPGEIMDEKLSYKEFLDRNDTWAMDDRDLCFESQPVFKPMEMADPFSMHRGENLPELSFPADMKNVQLFTDHVDTSTDIHAPHGSMMVPEQPFLGSPYCPAEVLDPSAFMGLDSAAEFLQDNAVPEEHWMGAQHDVKGPDASFFVEPSVPPTVTEAKKPNLPESPAAVTPDFVPTAITASPEGAEATDASKGDISADAECVPASDVTSISAEEAGSALAGDTKPPQAADAGFAPAAEAEPPQAMDVGFAPAPEAKPPNGIDATFAPVADTGLNPEADAKSHHAVDLEFAPAADAGFAPAADTKSHHAMDLAFSPLADTESHHAVDFEFAPPAEANHLHAMDSGFAPVAEAKPFPAADSGFVSAPEAKSAPAADTKGAASEELITSESSVEHGKSPFHEPPAEATASMEQELKGPEACVDLPLEKAKDNVPSPGHHEDRLPEQTNHLPEPAVPVEAKEVVALENKDLLPEKPVTTVDVTVTEKQKEQAEHNHIEHAQPQQEKALQEPTAKPEEPKPAEAVTGNDITAPPNKELPPSPEKKTKPAASTPSAKPAATKARPLSATSPKRPASAAPAQNKKPTSPTAGPTSATTPKRPATSTTRPSTLTPKETKPKVTDAKSPDKRTSLSKPPSSVTPRTTARSTPAAPKTTAASPVTAAAGAKSTTTSPPKRPTSIKTETKPADAKKTAAKSPSDLARPKSASGNAVKSSATTPTTTSSAPSLPGAATSRPKPKPAATKPTTTSTATADAKKPVPAAWHRSSRSVARPPGAQGLRNHGNTCFMNAVVQCLSNTAPLAEFLALGRYRARGARAEVTQRLAALVRALWTLDYSPRLSAEFKSIVSKHGAQFRGNAQHDALEFLLWLLDRMHEDLGAALPAQGPCTTAEPVPEQSSGAAAPRAQSFVQSHFQAQYRSSLTCPHCLKQSNTFDPFLCVSLPIPTRQTRALNVTLVLQREARRPVRVGLAVPLRGTVAELRAMVAREGDVPPEQVILAEVSPRGSLRSLGDAEELSTAGEGAALYALQGPPGPPAGRPPAPPMLLLLLCHAAGTGPRQARFGPPLVLWQERGASWAQLQRSLLAPLRHLMRSGAQGAGTLFRLRVAGDTAPGTYLSPQDARPLCHPAVDRALRLSGAGGPPHVQLTAEWDVATKERLFGSLQEEAVQDAESVRLQQQAHQQQHSCTLDECFQLYTKEEQLAPDDAWRCPHCQVPQQGTVKLSLWTLPDILIIHLKRFRQVAEHRHKLTTLVRFPLRGLDMAPHLAPGGGRWAPRRLPESRPRASLYDLYAVCNHHGSMQGGHYTAYCCNSLDGRWYSYDDSTVEAVQEDEVSTRSAYILFYQRRDAIPAWSASSAARGPTSSPLSHHWVARLGGSKRDSARSQPPAPRPSPPSTPDTSTAQEKGGFEARPSVRGVQSRSLSVKLPPARRDGPPRPMPLRWSFTSRPRAPGAPGELLVHLEPGHRPRRPHRAVLPAGVGEDGSPHAAPQARSPSLGEAAGTPKKPELPLCTPTLRRARSAGAEVTPRLHPKSKSPPGSGEQEQRPPRGRQEGKAGGAALCSSPQSPEPPIRRSQSSASLPLHPLRLLRRSASLGRGAGGPPQPPPGPPGARGTVLRGRERTASLRHAAVPESSF